MSCGVGCRHSSGSREAVAVAVAGSCNSNLTPSLGTSICCRGSPKKTKEKKKIQNACSGQSYSFVAAHFFFSFFLASTSTAFRILRPGIKPMPLRGKHQILNLLHYRGLHVTACLWGGCGPKFASVSPSYVVVIP